MCSAKHTALFPRPEERGLTLFDKSHKEDWPVLLFLTDLFALMHTIIDECSRNPDENTDQRKTKKSYS